MRDAQGRAYATGRRKTAAARVWVKLGDGAFTINGRTLAAYFPRGSDRAYCLEPLVAAHACGAFDVWLTVSGGGLTGQAGAIRHGLAKALARFDPYLKPGLKKSECGAWEMTAQRLGGALGHSGSPHWHSDAQRRPPCGQR